MVVIKQTNLNLVYPRITDYRKKFVNSEDILKEHFMVPTMLPVPEEVQPDVPRVIAQSKSGHSMLNIALSVASLTTNYDGTFSLEWERCKVYLEQRCANLYSLIDTMTEHNNTFVGLVTNVEIDDFCESGLDVLKRALFDSGAKKLGELYDVACKLTYVYKGRYYINITLENMREYEVQQYENGRACIKNERKHTISAQIDVNDRYAANNDRTYISQKEAFDEILRITSNIINNKLEVLVKEGEFAYDECE